MTAMADSERKKNCTQFCRVVVPGYKILTNGPDKPLATRTNGFFRRPDRRQVTKDICTSLLGIVFRPKTAEEI